MGGNSRPPGPRLAVEQSGRSGAKTLSRPRRSAPSSITIFWIRRMVSCCSPPAESACCRSRMALSEAALIRVRTVPSWLSDRLPIDSPPTYRLVDPSSVLDGRLRLSLPHSRALTRAAARCRPSGRRTGTGRARWFRRRRAPARRRWRGPGLSPGRFRRAWRRA